MLRVKFQSQKLMAKNWVLNIEQSKGFTLAQGEDELFKAAEGGAGVDAKDQR